MSNCPRIKAFVSRGWFLFALFYAFHFSACSGDDDANRSNPGAANSSSQGALPAVDSGASGEWEKGGSLASSAGTGGSAGGATGGTGGSGAYTAGSFDGGARTTEEQPSTNITDGGLPAADAASEEDSGSANPQCITDRETVLYLSADDSNSMASPVIVRKAIREGQEVLPSHIRTYEFTNYYDFKYPVPEHGSLNIVPQIRRDSSVGEGGYAMQIGVQSHAETLQQARPMVLTFVVDSSGSMSGTPLDLEKASLSAIASSLRKGDIVSMTSWNTQSLVLLDSLAVSGPNDRTLLNAIAGLTAEGSTDLHSGLVKGYEMAQRNFDANKLNRVMLISDGQANVGVTDENLIAQQADDSEGDAIYLIGVGCGVGYNDTLMDAVTDAGKGAYLFIDSPEEAQKQFTGERFVSNLAIAAMNVRVRVILPRTFSMKEFHGEQYSTDPRKVEPQHLAPNDAMIFHQTVQSCAPELLTGEEYVTTDALFVDPVTRAQKSASSKATLQELLDQAHPQLLKGDAVVAYAELFKQLPSLSTQADRKEKCQSVQAQVRSANANSADADLTEIDGLLDQYCLRF